MSSGVTRDITLVVRVQGPTGVSNVAGGGFGGVGGGGGGGGAGDVGGVAREASFLKPFPRHRGPIPAYGSAPGWVSREFTGIPGGARGGPGFVPYGGGFRSTGSLRPEFRPQERTPVWQDTSYLTGGMPIDDPSFRARPGYGGRTPVRQRVSAGFRDISSIPGGGGGGGFRSRPGFQGMIKESTDEMRKLTQATRSWQKSLGDSSLEMLRLLTWNRQITVGTFAMAEAQRLHGIPLVSGVGMAAPGIAGGVAASALFGMRDLWALRQPAGRAGFMDRLTGTLTGGFAGGGREQALIREQNRLAQMGAGRQFDRGMMAFEGAATQANILAQPFQAEIGGLMTMVQTGAMSPSEGRAQLASSLNRLRKERGMLRSQLGPQAPPFAPNGTITPLRQQTSPLGVGGLPSFSGRGTGNLPRVNTSTQAETIARMNEQNAREFQRIMDVRGRISSNFEQDLYTRGKLQQLYISDIANMRQDARQGLADRLRVVQAAQERLGSIEELRSRATFGLAGYSRFEVRSATDRLRDILAGRRDLPRGDQLGGALGYMISGLAPEQRAALEGRYRQLPDIRAAEQAMGLPGAVTGARGDLEAAQEEAQGFQERMNASIKELQDAIVQSIKDTAKVVRMASDEEADRNRRITSRQLQAAAGEEAP